MTMKPRRTLSPWKLAAVTAALCATTSGSAIAQDSLATTTTTTTETEEERGGFPWGILGLAGLLGLLGRRKTEEVHVHRETTRPVETIRPADTHTGTVDRTTIRPNDTPGTGGHGGTTGGTRL